MPLQPDIDPRAQIEAIFARERDTLNADVENATRMHIRTKRFMKPRIGGGPPTELELIEQAKAHAPDRDKLMFEQLEQIARIGVYVEYLRESALNVDQH